jgi:ferric-dicitrate binding protein FerR (iron transport regulator)
VRTSNCSRAWQAEAVEDGRLSDADRASFERHVETCTACRLEREELHRLGRVAARLPAEPHDALRSRRLHHELLRRANDSVFTERRVAPVRSRLAAAFLLFASIGALLVFWLRPGAAPPTRPSGDEPVFGVRASNAARWHVERPGRALRLALGAGEFTISVGKLNIGQSFVVTLPDGAIEVRGTRFLVTLDGSTTGRVAVEEGVVALRLRGQPELILRAKDVWRRAPASVSTPAATPSSPLAAPSRPASTSSSSIRSTPARVSSAEPEPERPSAARDFADAMNAFSNGDYATAERLFVAFEGAHPENGHVEDTRFLRALSRLRRGDTEGARALARDYLKRHPNGFRAAEAADLAR